MRECRLSATDIKGNFLKCLIINVRSIVSKFIDFECLLYSRDPHIIMVTESWANDLMSDADLHLKDYNLFRKDRTARRGGGCLIYCKTWLKATLNESLSSDNNIEDVWCNVKTAVGDILLGVCYQSLDSMSKRELYANIVKACRTNDLTIACGDFNHANIDWNLLQGRLPDLDLINLVLDNFMTQHVTEPTRGERILDLVLSKDPNLIDDVTFFPTTGIK